VTPNAVRRVLLGLLAFGAVSSIGGAVGVAGNGVGFPPDLLQGSVFDSFLIPGLILGIVVGGTQLAGAVGLLLKRHSGLFFAAVAGFGMLIWIFVELIIVRGYHWLMGFYFAFGIAELILVLALLGIAPKITPAWNPVR
jgi:hypothetical protein